MSIFAGVVAAGTKTIDPAERERIRSIVGGAASLALPRLWASDGAVIAHAQSFLTPEDRRERQPSLHGGGRFVLAFDGWLSNRLELIDALGLAKAGAALTDSTLVAAALLRWGGAASVRLRGAFAFAWWNGAERQLMLCCDQTGGRTLYYHVGEQQLYFATSINGLLAFPAVPRRLDESMLGVAALPYLTREGHAPFQEVAQLPAAGCMRWSGGTPSIDRYWRPDLSRRVRFARDVDYVDAARELLDLSVADHLRAEGAVVSFLTGGLDSTAVTATAARLTAPMPLHAITVRPDPMASRPSPGERLFHDEWTHAQAVAAMYPSVVAHAVDASVENLEDDLLQHIMLIGAPPPHLFGPSWTGKGHKLARQLGARVLLAGSSGNATLSYDPCHSLRQQAGWRDFGEVLRAATPAWRQGRSLGAVVKGRVVAPFAPAWAMAALRRWRGHPSPWTTGLRAEVAERIGLADTWNAWSWGDRAIPYRDRMRLWMLERTWSGRARMANMRYLYGHEVRDPLGDVRLVEFCLALPPEQYVRGKVSRYLARRVLADRLPAMVVNETRIGRQNAEWFYGLTRHRDWLAAELDRIAQSPMGSELLDVSRMRAILDDWPADADAAETRIQPLMHVLGRGVAMGRFIRWAEGDNG